MWAHRVERAASAKGMKHWNKTRVWAAGRTLSCAWPAVPLGMICPRAKALPSLKVSTPSLGICAASFALLQRWMKVTLCLSYLWAICVCVMMPLWAISALPRAGWWRGAPLWGGLCSRACRGQQEGTAWDEGSPTRPPRAAAGDIAAPCPPQARPSLLCWGHSSPQSCCSEQPEVSSTWFHHPALPPVPSEHFAVYGVVVTFLQTCTVIPSKSRGAGRPWLLSSDISHTKGVKLG